MIRFLLLFAAITAYSSVYSRNVTLIPDWIEKTYDSVGKARLGYVPGGYHAEYNTYYSSISASEKNICCLLERHGVREVNNGGGSLSRCENFVTGSCQSTTNRLSRAKSQSSLSLIEA